ncbi:putative amino-acid ABC transporter permease protein YckA [Polycladomyces abyssicola]|uniref:Putative amino-acid ABC transporter permease protein YckA n=1 Tax=Polycladomyces abyssicola TaxID=1125966 RepID=A0A8D5UG86_9BACL|nr:amino acid ABC transporter permease [Polycladomyces abyssicola]BCU81400.1 putative amino-acid ABC transporter permease protein YckA [Polycladomyces abyssicola]
MSGWWEHIHWENIFDVQSAIESTPFVLKGITYTISISFVTMAIGLVLGLITAMARMSDNALLRWPARAYISVIRGTPLLVQLLILYVGLPVIGISLTAIAAGVIGLSLNVGGYSAETIRGAILSIPKGQWEAAQSLNMTYWQTMRRIIIPQATRVALPSLANTFLSLVKDTSLLSVVTVPEMMYQAKIVGGQTYDYMTAYILVAIIYWIICTVLNVLQDWLEKRYSRFAA